MRAREVIAEAVIKSTVGEIAPYGDAMDAYLRSADAIIAALEANGMVVIERTTLDDMVAHAVTVSLQPDRDATTSLWWDGVANGIDRVRGLTP